MYVVATIIIIFKIVEVTHHYTSGTNPYDLFQQGLIICLSHIHVCDVHVYNYVVKELGIACKRLST